jgi:uncharacterized protein (DUF427 family)
MNNFEQPSPFHIVAHPERVRVLFEGHELADSNDVMVLSEPGKEDVWYFPQKDVQMSSLRAHQHNRRDSWKGEVTYYTIMRDGHVIEDIAWCYARPILDAEVIAGRVAFDPRHVEFQVETVPEERVIRHVPAHDPPYADDLDPMGRRDIPSTPSPRTHG